MIHFDGLSRWLCKGKSMILSFRGEGRWWRISAGICFAAAAFSWGNGAPLVAQLVPFQVPGDDATPTIVSQAKLNGGPIGKSGMIEARDGHFYSGTSRVRFWGVNLCFGANFPTHEEADKVAPHLAKLGVNAVRFHHMDMLESPNGIWQKSSTNRPLLLNGSSIQKWWIDLIIS